MKIYTYDICDRDKGLIIAENMEQAEELFEQRYPDTPIVDVFGDYDTCVITEVCEYSGKPEIIFLYD